MLEAVNRLVLDFDGAVFNGHKVTWPLPKSGSEYRSKTSEQRTNGYHSCYRYQQRFVSCHASHCLGRWI